MKYAVNIFVIFFVFTSSAQIIDNSDFQFMTDEPYFNPNYISKNNIRKIVGHYSFKAELDKIRKSDRTYEYIFNTKGQLQSKWTTYFYDDKVNDTTVAFYRYDYEGRITSIRKADPYGYYSYHYTYNDSGDVIFEEFRQDLKNDYIKRSFTLNENYRVYAEKSSYQYFKGQTKRTYYNNVGRPYQYKITYYNPDGTKKKELVQLMVNSGNKTITYEYNERNFPVKKTLYSNLMGSTEKNYEFTYDENGNLTELLSFKNGDPVKEVQIVYSWKTGKLKAFLTKKNTTNYITILEFDFEYFD